MSKQLDQYALTNGAGSIEMSEDEIQALSKELEEFLDSRLGNRVYACCIAFESEMAGQPMIRSVTVGLNKPAIFMRTVSCLKGVWQEITDRFQEISAPLQRIAPDNNPVIKQDKPA